MTDVAHVQALLHGHALVRDVDRIRSGPIRIETAFLYPDGSSIDLFLVQDDDLFRALRLSDLGQTMSWLLDVRVKPWLSRKRQGFIDDVLRLYAVEQRRGELVRTLAGLDALMPAIVALGQVCMRVADLMFTRRSSIGDLPSLVRPRRPTRNEQRVTVLDDRVDVYRVDDIRRLRDMSQLVAFSDRQTLGDLLAA